MNGKETWKIDTILNPACSGIFYFIRMREDLLHFIWKHQKFRSADLKTTSGLRLQILKTGKHNHQAGPDFLHSQMIIDNQHWAGNVEIHMNSSDWLRHGHQNDTAYNNVILHVVWQHDRSILTGSKTEMPTLQLEDYIDPSVLNKYQQLFSSRLRQFINCEDRCFEISDYLVLPWLEHLFRERLEYRISAISKLLKNNRQDWEFTLFLWMLKYFGQKNNEPAFQELGRSIDFKLFRKLGGSLLQLESLLFGMSGLLNRPGPEDEYTRSLQKEFKFLRIKYHLEPSPLAKPVFMRLRPHNFPTIRLAQFAALYHSHRNLFRKLVEAREIPELLTILNIRASSYWDDHYNFGTTSNRSVKKLSLAFKESLLINAVLPMKLLFGRVYGKDLYPEIRKWYAQMRRENNWILSNFERLKFPLNHALDSQALLHLYQNFCVKNRCLQCAIGNHLLN